MSEAEPDLLPELVLYFREGCHLCAEMEQLLEELLEPGSFRLWRIDIDENPTLREAYNIRVPVLSLVRSPLVHSATTEMCAVPFKTDSELPDEPSDNQIVLCEHFLDLEAVREALASYNTRLLAARGSPAE